MSVFDVVAAEEEKRNAGKGPEKGAAKGEDAGVFGEIPTKRYSIEEESGWGMLPSTGYEMGRPSHTYESVDTRTGNRVTGTKAFNQFVPPSTPLMEAPTPPQDPMLINMIGSFGGGMNEVAAGTLGLPVDALNAVLKPFGLGSDEPVGGSEWIKNKLFPTQYKPQGAVGQYSRAAGEQVAGMLPWLGQGARAGQGIQALKGLLPSAAGGALGVGTARVVAPDSPLAEVAGGVLGGGLAGAGSVLKARVPDLDNLIKKNLNTAIRPSVGGKKVASDISKFEDKGVGAVKMIVQDARDRGVPPPRNLDEFGEAIESLRNRWYSKYHAMTKDAGEVGILVDLKPLTRELDEVISNKAIRDFAPDVVDFAQKQKATLLDRGSYTPGEAEEVIRIMNGQLKAYYEGRSTGTSAEKAVAMAGIATKLRNALDDSISNLKGPGYQQLKNEYGQLKALEKDVVRRSVVDKRKAQYGFFDLSDMFSASKLVTGIMKAEPSTAAAGGAMLAIKRYLKRGNDPNKILETMFDKVDRFMPEEKRWPGLAPYGERYTTKPYEGEVTEPRALVPVGGPRRAPVVDAEYREVTPLPGGERAGLLEAPKGEGTIGLPWNPTNRPGAAAERMGNIQTGRQKEFGGAMGARPALPEAPEARRPVIAPTTSVSLPKDLTGAGFKPVSAPEKLQLWRMDSAKEASPRSSKFQTSSGGWSNDPALPEGRYFSLSKKDVIRGLSSPSEAPIKKGVKRAVKEEFTTGRDDLPHLYSVGKPMKDSKVMSIDYDALKNFNKTHGLTNKAMVTDYFKGKTDFLIVENFMGEPGYKEIIQLNPKKAVIRGGVKY